MQTELFDLPSPRTLTENQEAPRPSFLEKKFVTLRIDQTIGLVLALLVFYVLAFSWGVEKGRGALRASQRIVPAVSVAPVIETVSPSPEPVTKTAVPVVEEDAVPHQVPITVAELPKPVAKVTRPNGKYTIQHVTYMTQSAADREIQKLAKMGYTSFVIPSGKHLQVCIAAFQSRQDASQLLKKLRSEQLVSGDAYVRPMVR